MFKVFLTASLFVLALVSSAVAFAAGAGHSDEIPWDFILRQAVNVSLFAGILTYLLKDKIGPFFKNRVSEFEKMAQLAKKAREDAEVQKKEISARLEKLQATASQSVEQAKKDAEELSAKLKAEADALAAQIRKDAELTAKIESMKAQAELREELLSTSIEAARTHMKTAVKESDQARLQKEFVEKIQVIR